VRPGQQGHAAGALGFHLVNAGMPYTPSFTPNSRLTRPPSAAPRGLAISSMYGYVANGSLGLQVIQVAP